MSKHKTATPGSRRWSVAATVSGAIASLGLAATLNAEPSSPASVSFRGQRVTADTIARGAEIYRTACASCHGDKLQGQSDWRRRKPDGKMPAPPHDVTGHTWHHADGDLFRIVQGGIGAVVPGYESDMPAFGESLDIDETEAVLSYIKSTWPPRARAYQAKVTENAGGS